MTDKEAMKLALDALETLMIERGSIYEKAIAALKERLAQPEQAPVSMRMPKVGDRVICIEDESLGIVRYLTGGGSPNITFDDGSHGTYLLRDFAELFAYATPPATFVQLEQEPMTRTEWNKQIRDSVDSLLAKAGYEPESSARLQLAMMNFDTLPAAQPPQRTEPPQRTWVGLTDDEIALINADYPHPQGFARAIEAILKEKNFD
jgi:hypothetical protein